jgi:hypothetical protein
VTDLSRRGFLGAAFFGVVLAPFARGTEAVAARKRVNLYARRRFKVLLGRKFRLTGPSSSVRVRLIRISNLPGSTPGDDRCFALTFKAAAAGPPQGSYTLRRRGFAATTLFVVPDSHRRTYHAVVNRAH